MADTLDILAARLRVGMAPAEDLPGIAVEAILAGHESISLYQLAGLTRGELSDARDLARAALNELGVPQPSKDDALWTLVRAAAQGAVDGTQRPIDVARWIAGARLDVAEEGDLRVFDGLADAWDGGYVDHGDIEREVVAEAEALLARPEPRRWIQLRAVRGEPPLSRYRWGPVALSPRDLDLGADLLSALDAWAGTYEECADGFASQAEAELFVRVGKGLVAKLQDELGHGWHVEYWPEPTRPPGLRLRSRTRTLASGLARRLGRR